MKKKTVALLLACVMMFGVAVGGTMAWLTAETPNVTNTFTVGNIEIELSETDEGIGIDTNTTDNANEYHFVPGDTLPKDPKATVKANSEACWLFVKVTESNNSGLTGLTGKVINWGVDTTKWTAVDGQNNVWYMYVDEATAKTGNSWYILTGNATYPNGCVTVNDGVTKDMISVINNTATKPTLTFDAFAHQSKNTDLATATTAALAHFNITP